MNSKPETKSTLEGPCRFCGERKAPSRTKGENWWHCGTRTTDGENFLTGSRCDKNVFRKEFENCFDSLKALATAILHESEELDSAMLLAKKTLKRHGGINVDSAIGKSTSPDIPVVMQILRLFDDYDIHCLLHWYFENDEVRFCVNANDLFAWACAEGTDITQENLPLLRQSIEDCKAIDEIEGLFVGCDLFSCRVNRMRPQGAAYPKNREFWPLFNACGPEREIGMGNPLKPGQRKHYDKT